MKAIQVLLHALSIRPRTRRTLVGNYKADNFKLRQEITLCAKYKEHSLLQDFVKKNALVKLQNN